MRRQRDLPKRSYGGERKRYKFAVPLFTEQECCEKGRKSAISCSIVAGGSTRIMNFHPVVKHEDLYGHALCMDAVIPMDERVIQHFRDTSFYAFVVQETFPDGADIPQFVTGNDDSGNAQLWKICLWIQTKGQRAVHCGYRSDTSYERLHNCRFRTQSSVRHCPRCG